MFKNLVQRQFAVARHQVTVFGPHLDDYLAEMQRMGHGRAVLRRNLSIITRFGEYIAAQDVSSLAGVTRKDVATFRDCEHERLMRTNRAPDRQASLVGYILNRLLDYLEARGFWHGESDAASGLIDDFCRALVTERGLQPQTIEGYRHFLKQFLQYLGSDASAASLSHLTPSDVDRFMVSAGRVYGRRSMGLACTAIRALLRYLYRKAILDRDLSASVILPKFYALERLPCALPWEIVQSVVNVIELSSARGLRDRAILMLLVTYGVRPGEIVKLRLEDIDWKHDTIHVSRSKCGRRLSLPLTADVGEAIVQYLRRGRPQTKVRELFVRVDAPHIALSRGSVVSNLVRHYLAKAGIETQHMGAYVIRHSLAVHLLRKGHPLKTITDVLGHRDPRVAYQYTKLDSADLHGVALEAREVMP